MPDDRSGPAPGSPRPHGKRRRGHGHGPGPLTTPTGRPSVSAGPAQGRASRGGRGQGGIPFAAIAGIIGLIVVVVAVTLLFLRPFNGKGGAAVTPAPSRSTQGCPTAQPPAMASGQTRTVTLTTAKGTMVIKLEADLSPIAVGNFAALVSCGYYNGSVFHRVVPQFVIQGGDGPSLGYTIQDEPVTVTYQRGVVAMARTKLPNSVDTQFFIVTDDQARGALASANTYQIVGHVTTGMEVADAITAAADQELPTDPVRMDTVTIATP